MVRGRYHFTEQRGRSLSDPVRVSEGRRTLELGDDGLNVNDPAPLLIKQSIGRVPERDLLLRAFG